MSPFLLAVTLVVGLLIALGLHRVWAGPTVFDRLVAIALVTVNGVVVIVLLGFLFERPAFFFDIALAYALLAFILPIAISRYFEGLEPDEADGDRNPGDGDRNSSDAPPHAGDRP